MSKDHYEIPGPVFRYLLPNALHAFLKENPGQRQGQAVMNLLRHPITGELPTPAQVWNFGDEEIHERTKVMLGWSENRRNVDDKK